MRVIHISGQCDIEDSEKEQCLFAGSSESQCTNVACCYSPSSSIQCHYSKAHVAGFQKRPGDFSGSDLASYQVSLTECSSKCLEDLSCLAFVYSNIAGELGCFLKSTGNVVTLSRTTEAIYTYDKMAATDMTCAFGDCGGNDLYVSNEDSITCLDNCLQSTDCKGTLLFIADPPYTKCIYKSAMCTVTHMFELLYLYSCYKGVVYENPNTPDMIYDIIGGAQFAVLRDGITSTCLTIPHHTEAANYYKVRFPWPVVHQTQRSFNITLTGQNLSCDNRDSFVYVPQDQTPYYKPSFRGNFHECQFLASGSQSGYQLCKFFCQCSSNFCPSVYLFMSDMNGDTIPGTRKQMCEVQYS